MRLQKDGSNFLMKTFGVRIIDSDTASATFYVVLNECMNVRMCKGQGEGRLFHDIKGHELIIICNGKGLFYDIKGHIG